VLNSNVEQQRKVAAVSNTARNAEGFGKEAVDENLAKDLIV
jgi:hypothetical protein